MSAERPNRRSGSSSSSSSSSSTLLLGRLADISGALRTFVVALSGRVALSGQRWRLADIFWWRLADALALCGHKWRLADILQILALSGLSDTMALFSVFFNLCPFSDNTAEEVPTLYSNTYFNLLFNARCS